MRPLDFQKAPFLAVWEATRACALACTHCRADAVKDRDPGELTTEEGKRLLDGVAAMGTPIFIFSGGDPLNRPDLDELIRHAKGAGLRVGAIPVATERLDRARIESLRAAGLDQLALSLDGPDAAAHDGARGVPGSFARTLAAAEAVRAAGLPLQINTCLAAWNMRHLEALLELVSSLGVVFWEVFFLVPVGRGRDMAGLAPAQCEAAFARLHRLAAAAPFVVKIAEAQAYRRFVIRAEAAAAPDDPAAARARIRGILARPRGVRGGLGMSPEAVNAGKGFMFIDHRGDICPSGFLPWAAGNARRADPAVVYRQAPVFLDLRDPDRLRGRCGRCEFRRVCGGSRARAWALTGDHLGSDPWCAYEPRPGAAVY